MIQQKNQSTLFWVAGLGVVGYLLYQKYGNPLNALAPAPINNNLALQLPANVDQSYFIHTPQGVYSVDPAGVHQTGGIHPMPPQTPPQTSGDNAAPSNASGMNLS